MTEEPSCNPHPDAPHGFVRNASHNAGRYVCECEAWEEPIPNGKFIRHSRSEQRKIPERDIRQNNAD